VQGSAWKRNLQQLHKWPKCKQRLKGSLTKHTKKFKQEKVRTISCDFVSSASTVWVGRFLRRDRLTRQTPSMTKPATRIMPTIIKTVKRLRLATLVLPIATNIKVKIHYKPISKPILLTLLNTSCCFQTISCLDRMFDKNHHIIFDKYFDKNHYNSNKILDKILQLCFVSQHDLCRNFI